MPLTEAVYHAHKSDLKRWMEAAELNERRGELEALAAREKRLDAVFNRMKKKGELQ